MTRAGDLGEQEMLRDRGADRLHPGLEGGRNLCGDLERSPAAVPRNHVIGRHLRAQVVCGQKAQESLSVLRDDAQRQPLLAELQQERGPVAGLSERSGRDAGKLLSALLLGTLLELEQHVPQLLQRRLAELRAGALREIVAERHGDPLGEDGLRDGRDRSRVQVHVGHHNLAGRGPDVERSAPHHAPRGTLLRGADRRQVLAHLRQPHLLAEQGGLQSLQLLERRLLPRRGGQRHGQK